MSDQQSLHLWSFGPDTVVAYDEADALAVMVETIGENEVADSYGLETPTLVPDDRVFTIYDEDEGEMVTKLASEWALEWGRAWLCFSEY